MFQILKIYLKSCQKLKILGLPPILVSSAELKRLWHWYDYPLCFDHCHKYHTEYNHDHHYLLHLKTILPSLYHHHLKFSSPSSPLQSDSISRPSPQPSPTLLKCSFCHTDLPFPQCALPVRPPPPPPPPKSTTCSLSPLFECISAPLIPTIINITEASNNVTPLPVPTVSPACVHPTGHSPPAPPVHHRARGRQRAPHHAANRSPHLVP